MVSNRQKKKDLLRFNESFIKNSNENRDRGYILEADAEYPKKYLVFKKTYQSYQKEKD